MVLYLHFPVFLYEVIRDTTTSSNLRNFLYETIVILCDTYRVIHKSVKQFKISQQINYSTDHGSSYADRERNSPSCLHISQMLSVSTFGNTADIYAIFHLVPHACQHITVDQSHSSSDTVAKILEISGEWRHKHSVLHKPPEEKVARV